MVRPRVVVGVLTLSVIHVRPYDLHSRRLLTLPKSCFASSNHISSMHHRRQSVPKSVSNLPKPWTYAGCFVDNAHGRIVANQQPDNAQLTIESCVKTCSAQNFTVAAAEFSTQCFCGNQLIAGATAAPESDCNMGCGGNATEACGAGNRMSVYSTTKNVTILPVAVPQNSSIPGSWSYQGCLMGSRRKSRYSMAEHLSYQQFPLRLVSHSVQLSAIQLVEWNTVKNATAVIFRMCKPLVLNLRRKYYVWTGAPPYVWNNPQNKGYYDFLVPGIVVPLIATVGINGKVTFLEKDGTSEFNNSTGAYELDLSLVHDFHVVLPDKGGRILNVGGWSLDSTKGVRLYTPNGSAGVNGTNDWQENFQELSLQRQRWYPTAAVLANGSVLVIGGETGSNASPQPTWKSSRTLIGWHAQIPTTFIHLSLYFPVEESSSFITTKHVFLTLLHLARSSNFRIFPSVNNFLGGRTYPLEGAAVMFPQHAPYTDPVRILTCGGSAPGAGVALDNCVSIEPESPNPTWLLERMPSQRVMPCMTPLPDGTFMIMNGAHQGLAGFGLATNPNLGALLYDPSKPANQRISILNTTIVARLYHSEAILLPDARVLVSGSDPQTPQYPEEMRIEAYYPPYLTQGRVQPSFTIATTDWAYGSSHPIVVTLHQGTTSTMKVSLVAAVSSTHGNAMGARTIFPAFSCLRTTCTITAPPNAFVSPPGWHQLFILDGPTPSHSAWVRIGGDPAKLELAEVSRLRCSWCLIRMARLCLIRWTIYDSD
ncbi:hypothetical protein MVEN_02386300 [Mycena venus]|uniref:WSC domain-containing protein n=1 Tax=Mycena venus TaxID=2733690 RepID=A0A8H7CD50_9AGAR|nr:hypothetical protein MVEN_02386300 [Mycena venus]